MIFVRTRIGVKQLHLPHFSLVVSSWPSNGLVRVALRAGDALVSKDLS
jgi:hypothetical protein